MEISFSILNVSKESMILRLMLLCRSSFGKKDRILQASQTLRSCEDRIGDRKI
jgi:hypothetical protein